MEREEIKKTLEAILFDLGFIGAGKTIQFTDNYEEDYGLDSLDCIELIMEVEREFKIPTIPDDVAEGLRTVGKTITYLEEVINQTHNS